MRGCLSPQTSAAQGEVNTGVEANGTLKLTTQVKHLAPPGNVSPGAQVHAGWTQTDDGAPQSAGALRVGADLTGRLEATTPKDSSLLFVTTEDDPAALAPRRVRVLFASVAK